MLDIRETHPETGSAADEAALDAELQAMVRGWSAAVEAELASGEDAGRAAAIAARYAEAFPLSYRSAYGAAEAARDIRQIRALQTLVDAPPTLRAARLHTREDGDPAGTSGLRLKLYQREGSLALSDAVPVLENFGFRVLEELPTALDEGRLAYIHDFLLACPAGTRPEALHARSGEIEAALAAVLNGMAEDDPFNRLIVTTGLSAREADWLRAWFRYLRQAGAGYGIATVVEALRNAPEATRALLALFVACHDPDFAGNRDSAAKSCQ